MRLGVIDVGSNTVHLLVVDAHIGAHPLPASSHKIELRLPRAADRGGPLDRSGADALVEFTRECLTIAEDQGVEDLLAFATSAIREAPNGEAVLARVREDTGVELQVLSGQDESKLTFLAVRRWFGWSSGRLLGMDIGGGSLELAAGIDEVPDVALSLPLGAGRLTRSALAGDPPKPARIKAVRKQVRADVALVLGAVNQAGIPDRFVGTSKTLRSLARIAGAAGSTVGPYVVRTLTRKNVSVLVSRLGEMTAAERSQLPAVSVGRAPQMLAGAIIAEAAMDLLDIERLDICPWGLSQGVVLRRLDGVW